MNVGENIFSGTVIMSTYLWEELKVTFLTQSKKKKKKAYPASNMQIEHEASHLGNQKHSKSVMETQRDMESKLLF